MVVLSIGTVAQAQQPAVMDAILSSITEINKNITGIQTDIASMKTDIAVINTRLTTIEGTLERQNNRMDVVDSKVDGVDNTITQIQLVNLIEENMVPSSVGSEHRVHRQEKYFVSAEYVMILIIL